MQQFLSILALLYTRETVHKPRMLYAGCCSNRSISVSEHRGPRAELCAQVRQTRHQLRRGVPIRGVWRSWLCFASVPSAQGFPFPQRLWHLAKSGVQRLGPEQCMQNVKLIVSIAVARNLTRLTPNLHARVLLRLPLQLGSAFVTGLKALLTSQQAPAWWYPHAARSLCAKLIGEQDQSGPLELFMPTCLCRSPRSAAHLRGRKHYPRLQHHT